MKKSREQIVVRTSIIAILSNIFLSIIKVIAGLLAGSIAIILDALNNLSDGLSSIVTIVSTKFAGKAPDRDHPYGYGRIEYMASLVVSGIILYAGITSFGESFKKIINPTKVNYSTITIIVLVIGILVKIVLGMYVKRTGKKVNSDTLVASGIDAYQDAVLSLSVLISTIIYMIFKLNIEAYVGLLISIFIIKSALSLIKSAIDNVLGRRAESKLTKSIKKDILTIDNVEGVYDLILNDYGPDKYIGSVHIEVKDTLTVADIDATSRDISKMILQKYGIILHTIGVYSVNTTDKEIINIRKDVKDIVFKHNGILQMHGFYLDEAEKSISFDIIIDFKIKEPDVIYKSIYDEVKEKYKDYKINITLDIDASD